MLVSYHIPIHGASELDSVWAAAQNLMGAREGLEDIQRWFTHNSIWFTKWFCDNYCLNRSHPVARVNKQEYVFDLTCF